MMSADEVVAMCRHGEETVQALPIPSCRYRLRHQKVTAPMWILRTPDLKVSSCAKLGRSHRVAGQGARASAVRR